MSKKHAMPAADSQRPSARVRVRAVDRVMNVSKRTVRHWAAINPVRHSGTDAGRPFGKDQRHRRRGDSGQTSRGGAAGVSSHKRPI
jgi:hypothetical protein